VALEPRIPRPGRRVQRTRAQWAFLIFQIALAIAVAVWCFLFLW
jgi:hypothetical protein